MATGHINIANADGIVTLTLDRPPANAMDIAFLGEIDAALAALERDKDWQALIITGSGKMLSAGLDLKQLPELDVAGQDAIVNGLNSTYTRAYGMERPVITAVNGHALAGGMFLVLAADYRIGVSGKCTLGLTEARIGVPFPVAALEIARAELAPAAFRTVLMSGGTFSAEQALGMGVIDELSTPGALLGRAREKALEYASLPAEGFAAIKQQVRGAALKRMAEALDDGAEPALGGWVSEEARQAARGILGGK